MHDHDYKIEFLKTPKGYLTKTGFTNDINNKDIILCASNSYGKWSSMKDRIPYFARQYIGEGNINDELILMIDELETYSYSCNNGPLCSNNNDPYCIDLCPFWNDDRTKLIFFRHY